MTSKFNFSNIQNVGAIGDNATGTVNVYNDNSDLLKLKLEDLISILPDDSYNEEIKKSLDYLIQKLNIPVEPSSSKKHWGVLKKAPTTLKKALYDIAIAVNSNVVASWIISGLSNLG